MLERDIFGESHTLTGINFDKVRVAFLLAKRVYPLPSHTVMWRVVHL
jgi:hypothetical protein